MSDRDAQHESVDSRPRDTSPAGESYAYEERRIPDMDDRFFRIGEGRISGYISVGLGAMSLLAVLCFRYPTYLTTADLRAVYDPEVLRYVLQGGLWTALSFGALTFLLGRRRRLGAVGMLFAGAALLLGGWRVETGPIEPRTVAFGLDWMLIDLLLTATLFVFIEKIFPKYREQAILRPEWKTDLLYFAFNHMAVGMLLLVGNGFAPSVFGWAVNDAVQAFMTSLPIGAQLIVLVVCADFVQYWCHRTFHEVPLLWNFHAVHHCTEHMDWLAGSRNHIVNIAVDRSLVMVPLYLLGPSPEALNAYVVFAALQAVFIHANVSFEFGPLKYLLATPQFHHWHHSSEKPAIDTNYGVHLPVFDWLFGTYHMPDEHWPAHYGTTVRLPRTFFAQLVHPFRAAIARGRP